jgi:uncharacterized protein involved in exopolysaccharide biosynthesis
VSRPVRELRDPDSGGEAEVDLGRYASVVAARWWLALIGLVAGAIVGYALSLGGTEVYRAQALVYLGQPTAPGGNLVTGLSASQTYVRQSVRHEGNLRRVAQQAGIPVAKLRGRVTAAPVSAGTGAARTAGTPLWTVTVTGDAPGATAKAANGLAGVVVDRVGGVADEKVEILKAEIASYTRELEALEARIDASQAVAENQSLTPVERLVALNSAGLFEQRRAAVADDRLEARERLSLAENVERARVVERAVARKTTAQSRRNSIVVGAAIGLLLGLAAALLWEPVATRLRRA